jgi:hypothetical protein
MSLYTTDMYTVVERSIVQTLKAYLALIGQDYRILNNQVDKKKYKDNHATICIMKVSDVYTAERGGGQDAFIDHKVLDGDGNVLSFTRADWPDSYNLMYQLESTADNLDALRKLEMILRTALRPRKPMKLWDSDTSAFTTEFIEYTYAGYINRDIPENNLYNRVLNIRFEARNYFVADNIPAIKHIQVEADESNQSFGSGSGGSFGAEVLFAFDFGA